MFARYVELVIGTTCTTMARTGSGDWENNAICHSFTEIWLL